MLFNPHLDLPALKSHARRHPQQTLVVCYCAAWCDTCSQYQPQFEQLAAQWPQHGFVWVDIEENPEWLGEEDVEDFPTLLVQEASGRNVFFGTQLPHIGHLERLLKHLEDDANAGQHPAHASPPPLRALLA